MTKFKICGLFRYEDIVCANELLPDYAGFILNFPKSHRNLTADAALKLKRHLSPAIKAAGVFVNQSIESVISDAGKIGLDIKQLHGSEADGYILTLKKALGIPVWKAFRVRSASDLREAERCAADMILLDNGYGCGEAFDWTLTESVRRSFILAGGLTPENVAGAISSIRPAAVDVSSGVETGGFKDRDKMRAFAAAVRGA